MPNSRPCFTLSVPLCGRALSVSLTLPTSSRSVLYKRGLYRLRFVLPDPSQVHDPAAAVLQECDESPSPFFSMHDPTCMRNTGFVVASSSICGCHHINHREGRAFPQMHWMESMIYPYIKLSSHEILDDDYRQMPVIIHNPHTTLM